MSAIRRPQASSNCLHRAGIPPGKAIGRAGTMARPHCSKGPLPSCFLSRKAMETWSDPAFSQCDKSRPPAAVAKPQVLPAPFALPACHPRARRLGGTLPLGFRKLLWSFTVSHASLSPSTCPCSLGKALFGKCPVLCHHRNYSECALSKQVQTGGGKGG